MMNLPLVEPVADDLVKYGPVLRASARTAVRRRLAVGQGLERCGKAQRVARFLRQQHVDQPESAARRARISCSSRGRTRGTISAGLSKDRISQ